LGLVLLFVPAGPTDCRSVEQGEGSGSRFGLVCREWASFKAVYN